GQGGAPLAPRLVGRLATLRRLALKGTMAGRCETRSGPEAASGACGGARWPIYSAARGPSATASRASRAAGAGDEGQAGGGASRDGRPEGTFRSEDHDASILVCLPAGRGRLRGRAPGVPDEGAGGAEPEGVRPVRARPEGVEGGQARPG